MRNKPNPGRRMLPLRAVCERYGVCARTVDRWLASGVLPTPAAVINKRRYWSEQEIEQHERRTVANRSITTASTESPTAA